MNVPSALPSYRTALCINNLAISLLKKKENSLDSACFATVGSLLDQSVALMRRSFAAGATPSHPARRDPPPERPPTPGSSLLLEDALGMYYQALNASSQPENNVQSPHLGISVLDDQDLESLRWNATLPQDTTLGTTLPLLRIVSNGDSSGFFSEEEEDEGETIKVMRQCVTILYNQGAVSLLRLSSLSPLSSSSSPHQEALLLDSSLVSMELAESTLRSFLDMVDALGASSSSSSAGSSWRTAAAGSSSSRLVWVHLMRVMVLRGLHRIYRRQGRTEQIYETRVSMGALSALIIVLQQQPPPCHDAQRLYQAHGASAA